MNKIAGVLKVVVLTMLVTIVLTLVGSVLAYKLKCDDAQIELIVSVIYAVACLGAGFCLAGIVGGKRFLCGMMAGIGYFLIILIISIFVNKGTGTIPNILGKLVICLSGGIIGAILKK